MTNNSKIFFVASIGVLACLTTCAFAISQQGPLYSLSAKARNSNSICWNNIRLELNDSSTYDITHIGNNSTAVDFTTIPSKYTINKINSDAFVDCKDTITDIAFDTSIITEDNILNNCTKELNVTFSGTNSTVGYSSIFEGSTLNSVTIESNITSISTELFSGIKDIHTFEYKGTFDAFYPGMFPELWIACVDSYSAMPDTIKIGTSTYSINHLSVIEDSMRFSRVSYVTSKGRSAFGYYYYGYYEYIK